MSYKIQEIEGIGPAYAEKLATANLNTTDELLESCSKPNGRKAISEQTGLSEKLILEWTNLADLMRISGIGPEYADLLEEAGVDTIKELRIRNAENLADKMKEINETKKLTRAVPVTSVVEDWIAKAKEMEPKITY